MRFAAAPIRVQDRVVGAVGVQSDLEQRLALHQQGLDLSRVRGVLAERDAELRALTQGVRDYAIFTLDTEGRVSSWHPGAALMMGYSAGDAIGMPFERLFTAADRAAGLPAHELHAAAESGEYKGDGRRVRQDGSTVEVATVLTALKAPDGRLLGYLKLTQDISARLRREADNRSVLQAARQARDAAERASRSKDEFLATISHELRTPLSAILGWANVLERGVCDAKTVQHGLAAISRNARTQVHLIEDLLDMNRIENGQLRLDLQHIELGGIIAAAIDAALPAATAKGVDLRTTFGSAVGAVTGDAVRLQQVVANLLTNAIKFTPRGGEVNVTLTHDAGLAQIAVTDTGQGIESDFLLRMFDRFQQQDASTTRRHGGLGIGLTIVRELVQLHGGRVQAHSAGPGLGSTFKVTLPTHGPQPAEAGPAARASTQSSMPADTLAHQAPDQPVTRLDGVSVLLVEDEPDVRAVTVQMLQEAGAHVLAAASAEEGLELLRRHRPAVLLSDIGMPVTDGYELLRRVRELPAQDGGLTPAAAFTAYARPEDHQRVLRAGFQMHLAKPVLPTALVTSVAALLRATPAQAGST
jgi:PAS domain S-box-containing protein